MHSNFNDLNMERIDTKTEHEISLWLKEQKIDLEIKPTQYWQLLAMLENYHQHKLKLLGIANVVGQSEQFYCGFENDEYNKKCANQCDECKHIERL